MARSKLYGKIGKQLVAAVRAGGPDPVSNTKLKEVLAQVCSALGHLDLGAFVGAYRKAL